MNKHMIISLYPMMLLNSFRLYWQKHLTCSWLPFYFLCYTNLFYVLFTQTNLLSSIGCCVVWGGGLPCTARKKSTACITLSAHHTTTQWCELKGILPCRVVGLHRNSDPTQSHRTRCEWTLKLLLHFHWLYSERSSPGLDEEPLKQIILSSMLIWCHVPTLY